YESSNYFYKNDTWELSSLAGTPTWTALSPAGDLPAPREYHTAILEPLRAQMRIFGGFQGQCAFNDTYSLALGPSPSWTRTLPPIDREPGKLRDYAAIYDPTRQEMVF